MKYAVEVAKAGSLSKASETLLIAVPNISRSINELEADLGITIFDRRAKVEILLMSQFESFCRTRKIRLGIITVGKGLARTVCGEMIKYGITAIWNFAPCKLQVPAGMLLQNENLILSLVHLNNQLCNTNLGG